MKYTVLETIEYEEWLSTQSKKSDLQIQKRLLKIKEDGYFGTIKDLDDFVWELKWTGGRRIYYAYIPESKILLLLGGNKNGQDYDIAQAKKILSKYAKNQTDKRSSS